MRGLNMAFMQEDMEMRLSKMKVRELKELAQEKDINLSKCRTKKDYIARIVKHEASQHAELIHEEEVGDRVIEGTSEMDEDKEFASEQEEVGTMSDEEIAELDETLKSTKDKTVEFTQVNNLQRQMRHILKSGQYPELMAQIEGSIIKGEASFKKFQSIGLSLAIISSERYIDSVKSMGIGVDYPKNLLNEAKQDFARGAYDDASEIVIKIKDLTADLHREHRDKLVDRLQSLSARIQEAQDIGADMDAAELALKDATMALEDEKLVDCSSHMDLVGSAIEESWAQRTALIKETMDFIAVLIRDAEGIGGDTEEAQKKLDCANELFGNEEFQKCMKRTIDAESVVTELIKQQAQRAQSLLKTLEDRYTVASKNISVRQARAVTKIGGIDLVELKQTCSACGKPLSFIEKYSRWYCYSCEQYA
jgi:hypothetical protein